MIRLGVPSKGRLMEQTRRLVRRPRRAAVAHGLGRECRAGRGRECLAGAAVGRGEIPRELQAGRSIWASPAPT